MTKSFGTIGSADVRLRDDQSGHPSGTQFPPHLEQVYNVDVSPDLISRVTDGVMDEVREWQQRRLDTSYVIVYLDALRVKSKQEGKSCEKSVYVALGVNFEGKKEVRKRSLRWACG
jgi:transposase-like protein